MDVLLEWCSARQRGTRASFREAHAWCTGDDRPRAANAAMHTLEVLGHIEVDWIGGGDWAINPPVLALMRGGGGNAVAVGARSSLLRQRLSADRRVVFQAIDQGVGPASWYVGSLSGSALGEVASSLAMTLEVDVAMRYVETFVPLDRLVDAGRQDFSPGGTEVNRFSSEMMRFEPFAWQRNSWPVGAYEHRGAGPNVYVLRLTDSSCSVVDRRIAVHHELRRLRAATGEQRFVPLDWDPLEEALSCDRRTPLPLPQARAAILATGRLPRAHTLTSTLPQGSWSVDVYSGVHILTYKAIADALDIPLPIGSHNAQHQ